MSYEKLKQFLDLQMKMSHIYQPVMLKCLLENNGLCHESIIAKEILLHDQSQIEYYTKITNNMVGKVLRSHNLVQKEKDFYRLIDFDDLTEGQIEQLIGKCKNKLDSYLEKRGSDIWNHRRKTKGIISGTQRYEVLKRAKFHCELCGISADEKALEVDHVIPRNWGGTDDLENLQALCYSCNAMKSDRDNTNFRAVRGSYEVKQKDCLFCQKDESRIIDENNLAYVIRDNFPVTALHTLIIPKRHISSFFDLGQAEINALIFLLKRTKSEIEKADVSIKDYNIGINDGQNAGQTIPHCHVHLIPRREGDVKNPQGGIRHIIPGKGFYDIK